MDWRRQSPHNQPKHLGLSINTTIGFRGGLDETYLATTNHHRPLRLVVVG